MKKKGYLMILFMCAAIFLSSCSGKSEAPAMSAAERQADLFSKPISLSVYQMNANMTDAEFDQYFIQPVKKKYPNVTLSLVRKSEGTTPEELVAANSVPDIIFIDNNIKTFQKLDIAYDLNDFVKRYKVDLKKYEPTAIDAIKTFAGNGELLALPFSLNWYGLFYNKDIFDRFGVSYPKDSMTWDEVTELAKKVTRNDGGTQYIGLDPYNPGFIAGGLSLPIVDPKTNTALLDTEPRKQVYETFKNIFEIPGNLPDISKYSKLGDMFLKDKTVAMRDYFGIGIVNSLEQMHKAGEEMNWDVATSPNFKQALGTSQAVNLHNLMISKTSKYKEQAFLVIMEVLSPQVQKLAVQNARMSSLIDPELRKSFGTNLEVLKGKNMQGVFKAAPAKLPSYTEYDSIANGIYNSKIKEVIYDNKDINTAIREAEEEANQAIKEEMEKENK